MKDTIERQDIINELESWLKVKGYSEGELNIIKAVLYELQSLPSAQPDLDEWCTDCKEYDPKRHSCPRYNKVIREALKDAEPRKTGKWELLPLSIIPPVYKCSACGRHAVWITTGCLVNRHEESYLSDFCPHCGADMRGEQDDTI